MKFNLKKPCSNCPFRKDVIRGWLGGRKTTEMAEGLKNDKTFACHKTTGIEQGEMKDELEHSHCVGAMLVLEKEQGINSNFPLRLAILFGWLDVAELTGYELVFNTFQEMIDHHNY